MKGVIFMGLQASGKSSFYLQQFYDTHIRLNLDMLKTRHREQLLFRACLTAKQPLVIDNTNPTLEDRRRYIPVQHGINFNKLPTWQKRGSGVYWQTVDRNWFESQNRRK